MSPSVSKELKSPASCRFAQKRPLRFDQMRPLCSYCIVLLLLLNLNLALAHSSATTRHHHTQDDDLSSSQQHQQHDSAQLQSETKRSHEETEPPLDRLVKRDSGETRRTAQQDGVAAGEDGSNSGEDASYDSSATDESNSTFAAGDYEAGEEPQELPQPAMPVRRIPLTGVHAATAQQQSNVRPLRQSLPSSPLSTNTAQSAGASRHSSSPNHQQMLNTMPPLARAQRPFVATGSTPSVLVATSSDRPTTAAAVGELAMTIDPREQPRTSSSQQPVLTATDDSNVMMPMTPTFNVNMGADRMLIKAHQHQRQHQLQAPHQMTTTTTMATTQRSNSNSFTLDNNNNQEMATESVNHELLSHAATNGASLAANSINERRQDLIYPPLSASDTPSRHSISSYVNPRTSLVGSSSNDEVLLLQQQQQQQQQQLEPGICYTPLALLMVILTTMMITIVVCFGTHLLIKYLGRRQFDLTESSKQFDTKHGSGYLQERRTIMPAAAAASGHHHHSFHSNCGSHQQQQQPDDSRHSSSSVYMLSLLHQNQSSPGGKTLQRFRDEHGCAFDNPYFKDEVAGSHPLRCTVTAVGRSVAADGQTGATNGPSPDVGDDDDDDDDDRRRRREDEGKKSPTAAGLLRTATSPNGGGGNEQLHFIEHHISNLHNRQVTSSVKELSILGPLDSASPHHAANVVDLTSEEQRAKVIADPKEGDLVAVNITGHDFIGLGFDVCGGPRDGIFIKSVLARGPARESGCMEPGDRIKCLNISFENITLQDAFDILNCGAPYEMRLLLEKRAAPVKLIEKLRSPTPLMHAIRSGATTMDHNDPGGR